MAFRGEHNPTVAESHQQQGGTKMKKVLVLAAAITLLAAPAFAGIANTKHDLSSGSTTTGTKSTNYSELCVFCHTPHGATTGLNAPLWNRTVAATFAATALYNSTTLNQTVSNPTTVLNAVNGSDALLCLSCHDGLSLTGALKNPANSAANAQPLGLANITGNANLGTSLTNDHPIGMAYPGVQTADTAGFVAPTGTTAVAGLPLYGTTGVMWCSSCHDVHDNTNAPFLNVANAGSALCLTCHIK
jgi:predicted CXXCH cytochrome family protein